MPPAALHIPPLRITAANEAPVRAKGRFVLYWMTAQRRTRFNFALERAVALANELERPLLVLEALRCDYRWASDRHHRFVLDGMADNAKRIGKSRAAYHAYVEPAPGEGRGLVAELAQHACAVVADEWPCFFLRGLPERAAAELPVRLESVDGCGLLPLRAADRAYPTAHGFRRLVQKKAAEALASPPAAEPLAALRAPALDKLPASLSRRWRGAGLDVDLPALPIDHAVPTVAERGGERAALSAMRDFVVERLDGYLERNDPDSGSASGLSAWLHYGHVSAWEVLQEIAARESWTLGDLGVADGKGAKEGFWGMSAAAESFLDELVTWRELGHGFCFHRPNDYDQYESLPDWARRSLDAHAGDPRRHVYGIDELAAAAIHDPLWNAAQTQLAREGRIHNYLRMLWGKKILEWTPSPRAALAALIELNNRYAIDGRDPNSYSGIFWTLGRFDRPWAPERPVFGIIRYMSSENTARKLRVKAYVKRYAA
jgi:deoxyribodipyrimidine photo-lyase